MAGPLGGGVGTQEHPPHPGDVDGGPPGSRGLRQLLPPRLTKTLMEGPWVVLPGASAAATTTVDKDVDVGPPRGWCQEPRQRPPPK
jgi:hypothetical protein